MSQSPVRSTPMPQKWLASIHKYQNDWIQKVKYFTVVAHRETSATPGPLQDEETLGYYK